MKKKIVYISGADSFDAAQVRAAFDEVRNTLGLDSDTVLFGVPVDDLIALDTTDTVADSVNVSDTTTKIIEEPVKNTPKKAAAESPVVPILSVLGGKEYESSVPTQEAVVEEVTETTESVDFDNIEQMLDDEAPVEEHEKTLEELLETMTPLREDAHPEPAPETVDVVENKDDTDADATLASLASEFVDVQDKVPTFKKSSERGKISKLKNILPFKKIKRDDTGIMGDLFGWAGVAANDEDFSIPVLY